MEVLLKCMYSKNSDCLENKYIILSHIDTICDDKMCIYAQGIHTFGSNGKASISFCGASLVC